MASAEKAARCKKNGEESQDPALGKAHILSYAKTVSFREYIGDGKPPYDAPVVGDPDMLRNAERCPSLWHFGAPEILVALRGFFENRRRT